MAKKPEVSSTRLSTLASQVLSGRKPTQSEAQSLAASVLTQAPDKPKPRKRS